MSKLCQECPKWIDGTYTASTKRFGGGGGCDESSPGNYYRDWREDKAGPPPSAKKEFAANMSWTCQGHRKDGGKGRWKDWGKEGGRHGKDFKAGNCWSLGDTWIVSLCVCSGQRQIFEGVVERLVPARLGRRQPVKQCSWLGVVGAVQERMRATAIMATSLRPCICVYRIITRTLRS